MTTLAEDAFRNFDAAIDGVGLHIAWDSDENPYRLNAPDFRLERTDIGDELSENKLDDLYWGSQRSWHHGAGQDRLNMPQVSDPYRYLSSRHLDVTEPGKLTVLPSSTRRLSTLTNSLPNAPLRARPTDDFVYVAAAQPNLKRFSLLDASDAADVSTGTETSQSVRDFATDGRSLYIALGPDGTHRLLPPSDTQIDAMDSATGWTGTAPTADTGIKQEGAASLKLTTASAQVTAAKTISAIDLSGANLISIRARATHDSDSAAVSALLEIRLGTDASNYFYYSWQFGGDVRDVWFALTQARSAFSTQGAPNWASITYIAISVFTTTGATNMSGWFDDFRYQTGNAGLHFSDHDSRVLTWAKDRLYGGGLKSGSSTVWEFFEIAPDSGTASTNFTVNYTLPDGWEITSIAALGQFVYFAAARKNRGAIFAWDGETRTAFVAREIPHGYVPTHLGPFSGVAMLIGLREVSSVSTDGGRGVTWRGFQTPSGSLETEAIETFGADDGKDYSVRCSMEYRDLVYFGRSFTEAGSAGIGFYNPTTGAYGDHLHTHTAGSGAPQTGRVLDVFVFRGRRIFVIDGMGLWIESTTHASNPRPAELISSKIDLNVAANKGWLVGEVVWGGTINPGEAVEVKYSIDGGVTWVNLISETDSTINRKRVALTTASSGVSAPSIQFKVKLVTVTGTNLEIHEVGLAGWPATKPKATHTLLIRAFPDEQQRSGVHIHDRSDGWDLLKKFRDLRDAASAVEYQPPWWLLDTAQTLTVRVSSVDTVGPWGAAGERQGGMLVVTLKELGA